MAIGPSEDHDRHSLSIGTAKRSIFLGHRTDRCSSNAVVIGLGEATHGTGEFFTARGALTLELIRRAGVRLILFEFDAIASAAIDEYVSGADIDIAKAVAALGFWTTDTDEFIRFLETIRQHNKTSSDKVHIWGVDLQNTSLPG